MCIRDRLTDTQRIFFTVGNLEYLEHGGRIGKVASIAGKLLNVKPLITLKDGEIYSPGLKRGRKKSMAGTIDLLLDYMEENGYTPVSYTHLLFLRPLHKRQKTKKRAGGGSH